MKTLARFLRALPMAALALFVSPPVTADEIPLDDSWELSAGAETGNGYLQFGSGRAIRRDVRLQDGTIELDMQLTGKRSFVYLQFRMEADHEYEEIYFRPHKSELPDAIQYTPVFHGISSWQLYHGRGYTAPVELPVAEWVHVKLVLKGAWAAVFVGDGEDPDLVIPLVREPQEGYLALRGFVPAGSSAPWSARFAHLTVEPGAGGYDFSHADPRPDAPAGTVRSFEVSSTFVPEEDRPVERIAELDGRWETLATEPSGLLLMSRYRARPPGAPQWAMLARTTLEAAAAGRRRIELGYSDEVSVFLNGELIFIGDDSYSPDEPRRQGLIGLHQAALYLPVRQGSNELVMAVRDRFGGWGLMLRVAD